MELPTEGGRQMVADNIIGCNCNTEAMKVLAQLYINHIIRLFRQNKGRTLASSDYPSWPSFNDESASISAEVAPAPKDHSTAKRLALIRDNNSCMVPGFYDYGEYVKLTPQQRAAVGNGPKVHTDFCRIFPPSTNWDLELKMPNNPKIKYTGHVWQLVEAFGGIKGLEELNGRDIHKLKNGLTMTQDLHTNFDNPNLWFEEVGGGAPANTYWVRYMVETFGIPNQPVTFTSSSPELELPDSRYLRLHAAVCRVAYMSGATEYLDKHDRDIESISNLAEDGSSSELLASCLQNVILAC